MGPEIQIVGMGCAYAGADGLERFWETVLTRRRGFRAFPDRRMPLSEYRSDDPADRDKTYVREGAFLDGFAFDWKARRVPKASFEATDPAHWLALETARSALDDAGVDLDALGRERAGVILGNSLNGEVTRANLLRLRWPYLRRSIIQGAGDAGLPQDELGRLLAAVEQRFKAPMPVPNEDTLAGALANVIAGRICNVLDLGGGGYTIDGACASSLLAVANACEALETGRLDLVIAGGVDISLDPLEIVGFARTGALARGDMRVYDRNPTGFLPGEGCGLVVLMRGEDAQRQGLKPWANVAGWGVSSDGKGGITAPKASGQAKALRRCYERSGFACADVDFIEGHGTGTQVGDREELNGFLEAVGPASVDAARSVGVTSIKTLLGHTKAAAGAAGLIKAVLGVNQRVVPPLPALRAPSEVFATPGARIYPIVEGQCREADAALRAGVSGAGFGGINCHVAITGVGVPKRALKTPDAQRLLTSARDAELFITSAASTDELAAALDRLRERATGMADGELPDLAAEQALADLAQTWRAAVVAQSARQLLERLEALVASIRNQGATPPGAFYGEAAQAPRVGFLFPGQGAQFLNMGRALAQRAGWANARLRRWDAHFASEFPEGLSACMHRSLERAADADAIAAWDAALRDTRAAQPTILLTGLQWLQWLRRIGVLPSVVAGHSLGEIAAMVAASLLSESEAMDIVQARARACADPAAPVGGMAALQCDMARAEALIDGLEAVIANDNASDQVVISGTSEAMAQAQERAAQAGVAARALKVSRAFHSEHMRGAADALSKLAKVHTDLREARIPLCSAMDGELREELDPFDYAAEQVIAPVRFRSALETLAEHCDLLLELGPGGVLGGLARRTLGKRIPVCALEPGAANADEALCQALGQLFVAGVPLDFDALYADRVLRPFTPASEKRFITNPCGLADASEVAELPEGLSEFRPAPTAMEPAPEASQPGSVADLLRELVARETGYDLDMIPLDARLGADLNLDSIKVAEVGAELKARGVEIPLGMNLGDTPIGEIADAAVAHEGAAADPSAAPQEETLPLPADLPVSGYREITVAAAPLVRTAALPPLRVVATEDRRAARDALVAELRAAGVAADSIEEAVTSVGVPARLAALVGPGAGDAELAALYACVGAMTNHLEALALIAVEGATGVFGPAQSLHLEHPQLAVLAMELPAGGDPLSVCLAGIEPGLRLLRDGDEGLREPRLEPLPDQGADQRKPAAKLSIPLAEDDLILVSGGAKGITARCTQALMDRIGGHAALLGTSAEDDPGDEVRATLNAMTAMGLDALYLRCDVTDPAAVAEAVARAKAHFGLSRVAGIVHGAGVNYPTPTTSLDPAKVEREQRIKVGGLLNLLGAVDLANLKLCVALGSVIGSIGMHGNLGYALANERMAALLGDLRRAQPHIQVACPAFSVWAEVGMGARLNVLDTLARQGVAPVPVREGVDWFLRCCADPEIPLPLVVAAPMHGLPTWRRARGSEVGSEQPYVAERIADEPGRLVVSRYRLNPARDAWLHDHDFRGSLLFATVEALAALGQGACHLAGSDNDRVVGFDDLDIQRAIVASRDADTSIEIDLRTATDGAWRGSVGTPGSAHADPAFAAACFTGAPEDRPAPPESRAWTALADETGARLYDYILFQGPAFRRIEALTGLEPEDGVHRRARFRSRREAVSTPVPDVFFLDTLLQTVQVLVPRDLCLPVGIERIRFGAHAWTAGDTEVVAEITERLDDGYLTRVVARDPKDDGLVAHLEGYRVRIVQRREDRPDIEFLRDPLRHDRLLFTDWLQGRGHHGLSLTLGAVEDADQTVRRQAAARQLGEQLDLDPETVAWNEAGAPFLRNQPDRHITVAHDAGRLLTAGADALVGCDLQSLGTKTRHWGELLSPQRHELWRELTNALKDADRAGILVWAIGEALFKAGAVDASVRFTGIRHDGPRFTTPVGRLSAGVLEFALAGPTAVAVACVTEAPVQAPEIQVPATCGIGDAPIHFSRDIGMTFKEALPPLRSPTASVFFGWMGSLREEAMAEIRAPLAEAFGSGGKGMVTNGAKVRLLGPVAFATRLRAWVWLERRLGNHPSTFELGFQWAALDAAGRPERIVAEGSQRLTWVDIAPGGHVTVEPFPDFFERFIAARTAADGQAAFTPPLGRLPEDRTPAIRWRRDADAPPAHGVARLRTETDETHSNYVGNIYFSHAATLVERACLKALRGLGRTDEALLPLALDLDHLGEAMPGDDLEAEARLIQVNDRDCCFELSLANVGRGGQKIAAGRMRVAAFATESDRPLPLPCPDWLLPVAASASPPASSDHSTSLLRHAS